MSMRRTRYYICDVFTDRRFGGNQLAVLPEAEGLSDAEMQQIAREFNFSETTFVLPPEVGNTRRVRIFTPTSEIPFAGHPNVGTAFVLAATGALGALGGVSSISVIFEERAGLVPIGIDLRDGVPTRCQLDAPQALSLGKTTSPERAAEALSLSAADVVIATHPPQEASVGLPFLIVELSGSEALARARPDLGAFESLVSDGLPSGIHAYVQSTDEFDLRARMFADRKSVV